MKPYTLKLADRVSKEGKVIYGKEKSFWTGADLAEWYQKESVKMDRLSKGKKKKRKKKVNKYVASKNETQSSSTPGRSLIS